MRLFVALEIPSAVRQNLATLLAFMRSITKEPRWVRAENLHVTLKFLGDAPEGKIDAIRSALGEIRSDKPVALEFRGLGFFPDEKHPRVFWVGTEATPNLKTLAGDIEGAMEKLGISREKLNINGGACALGHPIGATGARLVVTLLHALEAHNLKRGIAALCIGGGEATAIAIERVVH